MHSLLDPAIMFFLLGILAGSVCLHSEAKRRGNWRSMVWSHVQP